MGHNAGMRRLLVILALLAMPIQGWDLRPPEDRGSAGPRADLTLDAAQGSSSAGIALRRISSLEQLLGSDAGYSVHPHFGAAAMLWRISPEQLTSGGLGSDDSLQAQFVRWQI
jgi:hypothetical protein